MRSSGGSASVLRRALRGAILGHALPPMWQALCADALFYLAFYAYGQALLARFGLTSLRLPLAAFVVLAYGLLAYFVVVQGNLRGELATSDIGCAILLGLPLLTIAGRISRPMDKLLGLIVLGVFLETVVRVASLLIFTDGSDYASLDAFFNSEYAFYTQVAASVFGFLLALTVLAVVAVDVIEEHRHAAEHDPLTELLNRRGFERALPVPDKAGFAAGTVVVCDIDHFKLVNDRFGHAAGDTVIVRLAAVLRDVYPQGALVTRLGGEEFAAFLPQAKLRKLQNLQRPRDPPLPQRTGGKTASIRRLPRASGSLPRPAAIILCMMRWRAPTAAFMRPRRRAETGWRSKAIFRRLRLRRLSLSRPQPAEAAELALVALSMAGIRSCAMLRSSNGPTCL